MAHRDPSAPSLSSWQMRLPFPAILALRYLRSARRDAYVSFLSLLAAGGIMVGTTALILVLAALNGLQDFLRTDVLKRTPHLEIALPSEAEAPAVLERLRSESGVVEARQLRRGRGWLTIGGRIVNVELVGFEGTLPRFFAGARGGGEIGEGIWVGDTLALSWGLEPGELVDVVSPRPTLTPIGPQPRIHRLGLAGTFRTGRTERDTPRVALPLATAERLLGPEPRLVEVTTRGLDEALALAPRLAPLLPEGSRVATWKDLNRGLFFALELEKVLMFVSVFLIVPIAAMALVTVLVLLVASKRAEIGILRTCGATPRDLRSAFLLLGTILAGSGLVLGGVLGIGGAHLFDRYRLLRPPGDVFFLDHVPFEVAGGDLLAIFGATAVLALFSAVWAARRAAALEPVEALRR